MYREYNDLELLSYINESSEEANEILYKKYEPLITNMAKMLINHNKTNGLEINDLIQEGMIGLSIATQTFDDNMDNTFYTYAKKCIERRMFSLIKTSNRLKHKFLNDSLSLDYEEDNVKVLESVLEDNSFNPEDMLVTKERETEIRTIADNVLTELELQVFEMKLNHFTYKEIAETLDKDPKVIDNAIQRIKNKLKDKLTI